MATAPRPGAGKRKAAAARAQRVARLTLRGETHVLGLENLPIAEDVAVRKACGGLPFSAFWSDSMYINDTSFKIMWWLARRADGEPGLALSQVEADWPDDLKEEDFEFEIDDPNEEDSSPEASGPGSSTAGPLSAVSTA